MPLDCPPVFEVVSSFVVFIVYHDCGFVNIYFEKYLDKNELWEYYGIIRKISANDSLHLKTSKQILLLKKSMGNGTIYIIAI